MIGTINVKCNAAHPEMALPGVFAFADSPSSVRVIDVPKKIGKWSITKVYLTAVYPNGSSKTAECVLTGGCWVGTLAGSGRVGTSKNGFTIAADGVDENGNAVTGYVLGKGDLTVLDAGVQPKPDQTSWYVRVMDSESEYHNTGDLWPADGTYYVWQNEQANAIGPTRAEMSAKADLSAVQSALGTKADLSALNEVENVVTDLGNRFQGYYAKTETSSSVELDAKFETKADLSALNEVADSLSDYYTKSETSSATEIQTALDGKQPAGDYALTSQLPTKTSELTNDSGYITSAQVEPATLLTYSGYAQNAVYSNNLKSIDSSTGNIADQGVFTGGLTYSQSTNTYDLTLEGTVKVPADWYLTSLFGETFSPKLPLEWCKGTIYRKRIIGGTVRWSATYTGWMWLAKGRYAITASSYNTEDGRLFVLFSEDETHQNCINDPATDVHTLTFTTDNYAKRIDTIDGQTGQASGDKITYSEKTAFSGKLAYEYQLSSKADVSALNAVESSLSDYALASQIPLSVSQLENDSGYLTEHQSLSDYYVKSETSSAAEISTALDLKQDKLSDAQISSINSVVDERKTYFTFPNNEVQSVYVEGRLDTYYLWELNPELTHDKILTATEVKIGTAVTEIGYGAFNGCSNLAKVTIPDSVVTIGEEAFGACYALVRLEIPDGVSAINNLFNYSGVNADIVFGKGLQSISQGMFHYVSPASVTFKGKTLAEVQAMTDYPWDIEDTSIIKTYNIATQEWVLEQLSALKARIAALEGN